MQIKVNSKVYTINNPSGVLLDLVTSSFDEIDLSKLVNPKAFDDCMNLKTDITTKEIVAAYKIADYLHSKEHMEFFGKEIARRIEQSTYNGIKTIINYF